MICFTLGYNWQSKQLLQGEILKSLPGNLLQIDTHTHAKFAQIQKRNSFFP